MKVILLILVAVINSFVLADVDHVDHLPTAKQQALSSLNAALNHPKGHEATSFQSTDAKPVNLVERKRASAVPESLTASKGGDNSVNYVTMGNQIVCNGKPYHVRGKWLVSAISLARNYFKIEYIIIFSIKVYATAQPLSV